MTGGPIQTRPDLAKGVWTLHRRLMGNLVPLLVATPFLVAGLLWMYRYSQIAGIGLVLVGVFPVAGWLGANFFGLYQNSWMKREMFRRLISTRNSVTPKRYFVGVATPTFKGLLDPHEDVGYLLIEGATIEFVGEKIQTRLERDNVRLIRYRPNVHTLLGLGRWISVEGEVSDKPVRLLIEPREKKTLLGNRRFSKDLKNRLDLWLKDKTAPGETPEADPDVLSS